MGNWNPHRFRPGPGLTPEQADALSRMDEQIRRLSQPATEQGTDIRITEGAGGFVWGRDITEEEEVAPDETVLAQLTAKCYYDGSDTRDADGFTPTGDGLNCPPDLECLGRFIIYSWVEVEESENDGCPLTFSELSRSGSPQCFPAYHPNNVDLPVFPPPSPRAAFSGDASNDAGAGDVPWSKPENAEGEADDAWATCALMAGQSTQYLFLEGFCFGVPGNATITNVEVRVDAHASDAGISDLIVKLLINGVVSGNSKHTGDALGTSDAVRSYSHNLATWGVTLPPLEANRTNFGVALRYNNTSGATRTVFVDDVEIKISFTPSGLIGVKHSIVRLRRGEGDYYLIEPAHLPWIDLFRRTDTSDADGIIAFHRYWDPNAGEYRDGEEVRLTFAD